MPAATTTGHLAPLMIVVTSTMVSSMNGMDAGGPTAGRAGSLVVAPAPQHLPGHCCSRGATPGGAQYSPPLIEITCPVM
jgi:hypothetical protein